MTRLYANPRKMRNRHRRFFCTLCSQMLQQIFLSMASIVICGKAPINSLRLDRASATRNVTKNHRSRICLMWWNAPRIIHGIWALSVAIWFDWSINADNLTSEQMIAINYVSAEFIWSFSMAFKRRHSPDRLRQYFIFAISSKLRVANRYNLKYLLHNNKKCSQNCSSKPV